MLDQAALEARLERAVSYAIRRRRRALAAGGAAHARGRGRLRTAQRDVAILAGLEVEAYELSGYQFVRCP